MKLTSTHDYVYVPLPLVRSLTFKAIGVRVNDGAIFSMVMACLKFLRFKTRRSKRVPERVVAVAHEDEYDYRDSGNRSEDSNCVSTRRRYTWEEMKILTRDFSRVIGSGGFSTVYLAQFSDSTLGAIKIQCSSERLNRVYRQELQILLRLRHPTIVKLLGYCHDREEGVLVFEYVPNGNLQEKLHGGGKVVLSWERRMAIAFQLAQAMEYLHEKCSLQIVHGDIKASNILLDEHLNCKLCDFGSAKMGFSSTVLPPSSSSSSSSSSSKGMILLGSQGYVDPHYLKTGIASKKNDVYSFGVIVLELVTGIQAFCLETGEKLTSIAGPMLLGVGGEGDAVIKKKVGEMVDPRLDGDFDLEEARAMASISAMTLSLSPALRPSASDILSTMRDKIPSLSFLFSNSTNQKRFQESPAPIKG